MLPYSSSSHLNESFLRNQQYKNSIGPSNSLIITNNPNIINTNAEPAYRILFSLEKLLSDPKQTATALLAVKYGIFESTDTNLSYNLMALVKLLSEHPSAWNVVDQSLTDKVSFFYYYFKKKKILTLLLK